MGIHGFICGPKLYEFDGWFFEVHGSGEPWPLKKDGELRKRAGKKFYDMYCRFDRLSKKRKQKYRVGGGCQPFGDWDT